MKNSKDNTFTIIVNEACPDSWPDIVWRDARNVGARILLDSCTKMIPYLRKLRRAHFSNVANRKIWLPLKCVWDFSNTLRLSDLDSAKRNYVIFQTGIKFSAHYIERLKRERNACIVLYMPDNIRTMNMAQSREEFDRFRQHYHIDQVYSFDKKDCEEFGADFFDFYSMVPNAEQDAPRQENGKLRILYVGGCRSIERLNILHELYDKLKDMADCTFYLNGVASDFATRQGVIYNHPLSYAEVVRLVQQHDVIVEIMNGSQAGNTLRLKEAVCYNKLLLTNNQTVLSSPYYDSRYIQVFDNVDGIDLSALNTKPNYRYQGEFSTKKLLDRIIERDHVF